MPRSTSGPLGVLAEVDRRAMGNQAFREAWLREALGRLPAGSSILDAGAGTQRYRAYCEHLVYTAQDFAQYDGTGDGTGAQTGSFDYGRLDIVSDITAIPRPDASFDAVMCVEVLEHVPDPAQAVAELVRLLKPGGTLLLTAPFASLSHYAPYHFAAGFNRYWYEHHLSRLGLDVVEATPHGGYFDVLLQEVRRLPAIARRYAGRDLTRFERLACKAVARLLRSLRAADGGSSELWTYGYHVRALKRAV